MDFSDIDWWLWLSTPTLFAFLSFFSLRDEGINFRFGSVSGNNELTIAACGMFEHLRLVLGGPHDFRKFTRAPHSLSMFFLSLLSFPLFFLNEVALASVVSWLFILLASCVYLIFGALFTLIFEQAVKLIFLESAHAELPNEHFIILSLLNGFAIMLFYVSKVYSLKVIERDARESVIRSIYKSIRNKEADRKVISEQEIDAIIEGIENEIRSNAKLTADDRL